MIKVTNNGYDDIAKSYGVDMDSEFYLYENDKRITWSKDIVEVDDVLYSESLADKGTRFRFTEEGLSFICYDQKEEFYKTYFDTTGGEPIQVVDKDTLVPKHSAWSDNLLLKLLEGNLTLERIKPFTENERIYYVSNRNGAVSHRAYSKDSVIAQLLVNVGNAFDSESLASSQVDTVVKKVFASE